MRKLLLLCLGVYCAYLPLAQPVLQTSLLAGVSIPLQGNALNGVYNGAGIHFGNSLDYFMGTGAVRFGIGSYIGFVDALGTDSKYRRSGEAIAEKYGMSSQQLAYSSSPFKSTHLLLGPVASMKAAHWDVNLWAKGGYGVNEPGGYSVTYHANGVSNNIYVTQGGDNRNGLAYSLGGGIRCGLSDNVSLQLAANYFNTQTDLVNYNFDREKGLKPLFSNSKNEYLQASAGLVFTIGRGGESDPAGKKGGRNRQGAAGQIADGRDAAEPGIGEESNPGTDSLYFSPEKLVIRSVRQMQGASGGQGNSQPLEVVNNFLTGFVYRSGSRSLLSQCGAAAMPGDPVPGIDVKFICEGCSSPWLGRTNADGSFTVSNIPPGNYRAIVNSDTVPVGISNYSSNPGLSLLEVPVSECTSANNVVYTDNKMYVEVIAVRESNSGMASGRRAASSALTPLPVSNMEFDVNWKNVITSDGRLYAEVSEVREPSSGMANGRSALVTGDLDGDGFPDYTGEMLHLHKEKIIHRDLAAREFVPVNIGSPRDHPSGQSSGRMVGDTQGNAPANGDPAEETVNPLYTPGGHEGVNPLHDTKDRETQSVGNNPLYQPKDQRRMGGGDNPLFEPNPKEWLRVNGSNGIVHAVFLPATLDLKTVVSGAVNAGSSFDCAAVRWIGGKLKTDNGGGSGNVQKATVNTTRSNIKHNSRISCLDGTCTVECVVEINGAAYDAVVTGRFKKG